MRSYAQEKAQAIFDASPRRHDFLLSLRALNFDFFACLSGRSDVSKAVDRKYPSNTALPLSHLVKTISFDRINWFLDVASRRKLPLIRDLSADLIEISCMMTDTTAEQKRDAAALVRHLRECSPRDFLDRDDLEKLRVRYSRLYDICFDNRLPFYLTMHSVSQDRLRLHFEYVEFLAAMIDLRLEHPVAYGSEPVIIDDSLPPLPEDRYDDFPKGCWVRVLGSGSESLGIKVGEIYLSRSAPDDEGDMEIWNRDLTGWKYININHLSVVPTPTPEEGFGGPK